MCKSYIRLHLASAFNECLNECLFFHAASPGKENIIDILKPYAWLMCLRKSYLYLSLSLFYLYLLSLKFVRLI